MVDRRRAHRPRRLTTYKRYKMKVKTFLATVGMLVALSSCLSEPLSDAKASTDAYLRAIRIVEVPDGKADLARHGWAGVFPQFAPERLPVIKETTTLFEGVFDTDVPNIKGYKRLLQVTEVSQGPTRLEQLLNEPGPPAGALKHEKYMAVAYMDQSSKKWRIYSFAPAADTAREAASAREWATKEDGVHPKFKYRNLAHWLILDGSLRRPGRLLQDQSNSHPRQRPTAPLTPRLTKRFLSMRHLLEPFHPKRPRLANEYADRTCRSLVEVSLVEVLSRLGTPYLIGKAFSKPLGILGTR